MKYLHTFFSIQGENLHVGVPSIFLRLVGCNFQCKGFGNPTLEKMPYEDLPKVKSFNDLPITDVGCDSYASWHKDFKYLWKENTPKQLYDDLTNMAGDNWNRTHLVITGGEPLLKGNQAELAELINYFPIYSNITFETNGTQIIYNDLFLSLLSMNVLFSVSTKLSNSGEDFNKRVNHLPLLSFNKLINSKLSLKFVVDNEKQIDEIKEIINIYEKEGVIIDYVYLMPVGGTYEKYKDNSRLVAEMALKYRYRYSPRLQNDLWKNQWGT